MVGLSQGRVNLQIDRLFDSSIYNESLMVHTKVFMGHNWIMIFILIFKVIKYLVFVGDILRGKKGLILNILFFVFIKSTVLRYFLM